MVQNGIYTGRAPGRLDVMGGISDYSGSLLLQMPIEAQTSVTIRAQKELDRIRVRSEQEDGVFEIELSAISGMPYREFRDLLRSRQGGDWAGYVIGCFAVLQQEKGLPLFGADVQVDSRVPMGKGVSSSAALEVATMHAISKALGVRPDPVELAVLAQRVENQVVGAACGLMDQLSVNLGRKNRLLPIICQPHEVQEPVPIPGGLSFYGLDSGVRHAVSGASYGDVRTAAFMAYTVAMIRYGYSEDQLRQEQSRPFGGRWANVGPAEFERDLAPLIPAQMKGSEFLARFGIYIDDVTAVDPGTTYNLLAAASHPVMENDRIHRFRQLLETYSAASKKTVLAGEIGSLMFSSHEGYGSVGLGEPVTDRIVELVREAGPERGISGARISGGGSGGTVAILVNSPEGYQTLCRIHEALQKETGKSLTLFHGSSDGAHFIN